MIQNAKITSIMTNPESYHLYNPDNGPRGDKEYVMSRSDLMEFWHCPHRWIQGYHKKAIEATDYGSLIDCYVLDNKSFGSKYAVAPREYFNKKDGKDKPWNWNATFCKEWRSEQVEQNKVVIKSEELEACKTAGVAMLNDKIINRMLDCSDKQVMLTGVWQDKSGLSIPLKTLIDIVPSKDSVFSQYLCDLKTCRTASPSQWPREVWKYGYHVQAAFYTDMYYAATGEARDGFTHILQESYEPYEIGRRLLSEEFIEEGREKYQSALNKYCQCLKSGVWPGYDDDKDRSIDGFTITEPEAWMIGAK